MYCAYSYDSFVVPLELDTEKCGQAPDGIQLGGHQRTES
jgi:hypothetical protein